jgi:hypothetical protein
LNDKGRYGSAFISLPVRLLGGSACSLDGEMGDVLIRELPRDVVGLSVEAAGGMDVVEVLMLGGFAVVSNGVFIIPVLVLETVEGREGVGVLVGC